MWEAMETIYTVVMRPALKLYLEGVIARVRSGGGMILVAGMHAILEMLLLLSMIKEYPMRAGGIQGLNPGHLRVSRQFWWDFSPLGFNVGVEDYEGYVCKVITVLVSASDTDESSSFLCPSPLAEWHLLPRTKSGPITLRSPCPILTETHFGIRSIVKGNLR